MSKPLTVALVGNPNTGKTTLFNLLTGARERTGNWTGVTVECAQATFSTGGQHFTVTDLPGIYSFAADTADERAARDFLIKTPPSVVVNILDASNLERSLYLTSQLLDMRVPMVVALNQTDIAEDHGMSIDHQHLAQHLGCPVVPMVASRRIGMNELKAAVLDLTRTRQSPSARVTYGDVEHSVQRLQMCLIVAADDAAVDSRWLAIKLLEGDRFASDLTGNLFAEIVAEETDRILRHTGHTPAAAVMDARLGFIRGLAHDVVKRHIDIKRRLSDIADRLLLSRPLGIPAFLCVMYAVFWSTVNLTQPLVDFIDTAMSTLLVTGTRQLLENARMPELLVTLLADGAGAGLSTVATFMPPIFMIFMCLSLLEESGYMARAAFIMDRFLAQIGLPGKAFIPLLVGFGCTVPALMATRTLEQRRDRVLTMLITPFMSCGARLPVYAIFAMAFFPSRGGTVIFSLYLTGALLAILSGFLLHRTLFKGEASSFVMELPPYHVPVLRGCLEHVWFNLKSFLTRAGKLILLIAMALSLANHVFEKLADNRESAAETRAAAGRIMTRVFRPMGIGADNWPAAAGLLSGLMAKEAVVGTLDVLYSHTGEEPETPVNFGAQLRGALRELAAAYGLSGNENAEAETARGGLMESLRLNFGGRHAAFAYLLFVLIYSPCMAALAVLGREAGWRWMFFSVVYQTLLAWIAATVYYQTAMFSQAPASACFWLLFCAALTTAGIWLLKIAGQRGIRLKPNADTARIPKQEPQIDTDKHG
ncbi:MAG: ferrous iron transport protein B [Kiritimatiellae bacterium]|nr:ferrous iron transport protein B [Kiritimatiellia bacterium]